MRNAKLEYLNNEWDERVVNQFIDLTDNFLEQILINPKQFPLIHKKKKVRKCVITKHNTLFYRDSKNRLIFCGYMIPDKILKN